MLRDYTSRSLTNSSDKLPALAGLAAAFAEKTKDVYLNGLWMHGLPEGLLWSSPGLGFNDLGNSCFIGAVVLLRMDLHEHLARTRATEVDECGFGLVSERLPRAKTHSLADSRHVRVELIGEKQHPPSRRRALRAPRRVDVEARLPGHLNQSAVRPRPRPELAVAALQTVIQSATNGASTRISWLCSSIV